MKTLPTQIVSLIHYVELTNDGWWITTIDRCILAVLHLLGEPVPEQKIKKEIANNLFLDIKTNELKTALERLKNHGDIVSLPGGNYSLSIAIKEKLRQQVEENANLEKDIRSKFEQCVVR